MRYTKYVCSRCGTFYWRYTGIGFGFRQGQRCGDESINEHPCQGVLVKHSQGQLTHHVGPCIKEGTRK